MWKKLFMCKDKVMFYAQIFIIRFFNSINVPWEITKLGKFLSNSLLCRTASLPHSILSASRVLNTPKGTVPHSSEDHFLGGGEGTAESMRLIYSKHLKNFRFITFYTVQDNLSTNSHRFTILWSKNLEIQSTSQIIGFQSVLKQF